VNAPVKKFKVHKSLAITLL